MKDIAARKIQGMLEVEGVQGENGERVRPGLGEFWRENARVGQRMTVDLARQNGRNLPGQRLLKRGLQLLVRLVDMKGAAERGLGRDARV